MFRVDLNQNRISRLTQKRFGDLDLRERDHLQEWLVHQPDALGEELLIIQKEFDGFDETRERLDLLALDKGGNLVVIENKLDDSGRDVTWQALKYTAYVSSLSKTQIVEIFQQYLDRYCGGGEAISSICEFLDVDDLGDAELNPGNNQRIMFIAANFRREVTATVLWLLSKGVQAQCFKVAPYGFGEELFIDLQQIIPPPEAADYMIGISNKEAEEAAIQGLQKHRHKLRLRFWGVALERMRAESVSIFSNISPQSSNWISAGAGISGCAYGLVFGRSESRVEISFTRGESEENKWLFDQLIKEREQIEGVFGASLDWRRNDDKKICKILFSKSFDGYSEENWPEISEWMATNMKSLEAAFSPRFARLSVRFRNRVFGSGE